MRLVTNTHSITLSTVVVQMGIDHFQPLSKGLTDIIASYFNHIVMHWCYQGAKDIFLENPNVNSPQLHMFSSA